MKVKLLLLFIVGICSSKERMLEEIDEIKFFDTYKNTKSLSNDIYESEEFKIRYKSRKSKPNNPNFKKLETLSYKELRLLKFELMAKNGYLFEDAVLRDYFNQFEWYQPIYWIENLKFQLDSTDNELYKLIKAKESVFLNSDDYKTLIDTSTIVNMYQFGQKNEHLYERILKYGYAIERTNYPQMHSLYERNKYRMVPSFVTTDLYLNLISQSFTFILSKLEEELLTNLIQDILILGYNEASLDVKRNPKNKEAKYAQFYFAIGLNQIANNKLNYPKEYKLLAQAIEKQIKSTNSKLEIGKTDDTEIDFTLFKPRGTYEKTEKLKKYFRTVMWLNKCPFPVNNKEYWGYAEYIGKLVKKNELLEKKYKQFLTTISYLFGKPDNLSIMDISNGVKSFDKRIMQKGGLADNTPKAYFTTQLFTPDAYIFSKMVNLARDSDRREFPKALDVFAVFGNKSSEKILIEHYKEVEKWAGYKDRLDKLKSEFKNYIDNTTLYDKWIQMLISLDKQRKDYPLVMQKDSWKDKNLNTSLASYSELKHNTILYAEQASGAEQGDGIEYDFDLPDEPITYGYVEPNVDFWNKSTEFIINMKEMMLSNYNNDTINKIIKDLEYIGSFCKRISNKELKGLKLSREEHDTIIGIGKLAEDIVYSTFRIPKKLNSSEEDSDFSYWNKENEEMPTITDIFTTNDRYLQIGIGKANSIYVVVNINGANYLTQGAVYSYYEFVNKSGERLTDTEWKKIINEGNPYPLQSWFEKYVLPAGIYVNDVFLNYYPTSFIKITDSE